MNIYVVFSPIVRSTIGHRTLFYCAILVKTLKNTGPWDRAKLFGSDQSGQLCRGQDSRQTTWKWSSSVTAQATIFFSSF